MTVEQQKQQICGGVDLGIFICSAEQRREERNEGESEEKGKWRDYAKCSGTEEKQRKAERRDYAEESGNGGKTEGLRR